MSKDDTNIKPTVPLYEQRELFDKRVLDDMYDIFIKKKKEAAERRLDASAMPMITYVDGRWKLTVHESVINSDESLGIAIVSAIKATGDPVDVYKIKSSFTYVDAEGSQKFFYGVALGSDDVIPTRLDRTKRGIELGRAFAYAIRVHGEFQQNNRNLGLSALKRDQFFFGNNFGETDSKKNQKVVFGMKTIFRSYFEDPKVGDAYYEVLSKLLHRAGLGNHSDEQYAHAMELFILPFDEFIAKYNRPVTTPVSRNKSKTTLRKPNKPTRSPVFLKAESKLLSEILTPVWENLDTFKKGWLELIKSWGFSAVAEKIGEIMTLRWTILESFSRITTSRLNAIRSLHPEVATAKKSEMTIKLVTELLHSRKYLVDGFVSELIAIIPSKMLNTVIAESLLKSKTVILNTEDCLLIIASRVYDIYQRVGFVELGPKPEASQAQIPKEDVVAHIFNYMKDHVSRIQQFKLYESKLHGQKNNQSLSLVMKMMISMKGNIDLFYDRVNKSQHNVVQEVYNLVRTAYPITNKITLGEFINMSLRVTALIERLEKIPYKDDESFRPKVMNAFLTKP
jgi:hypothetical protein